MNKYLVKTLKFQENATSDRISPQCEAVTVFAKEKRRRRVIFYVWIHILTFSQNYAIPSLAGWAEWQQRGGGGEKAAAAFHPIINLVQFLDVRLVHSMYVQYCCLLDFRLIFSFPGRGHTMGWRTKQIPNKEILPVQWTHLRPSEISEKNWST